MRKQKEALHLLIKEKRLVFACRLLEKQQLPWEEKKKKTRQPAHALVPFLIF